MSSLFACSVQGFMFLKGLFPHLLMLKINQFHLLVVLFLGFFFFHLLPFRPISTKPYGSWEKESNELYFQIWTKGAVVSKRSMNAWDTVLLEGPPVLSVRTKEKADGAATAKTEILSAFTAQVLHFHLPPPVPHPFPVCLVPKSH